MRKLTSCLFYLTGDYNDRLKAKLFASLSKCNYITADQLHSSLCYAPFMHIAYLSNMAFPNSKKFRFQGLESYILSIKVILSISSNHSITYVQPDRLVKYMFSSILSKTVGKCRSFNIFNLPKTCAMVTKILTCSFWAHSFYLRMDVHVRVDFELDIT